MTGTPGRNRSRPTRATEGITNVNRFRQDPAVRAAQAALDAYTAKAVRDGNHEETDEYVRLNDAVNAAIEAAKQKRD
jgi:hypothetical protein